MRKFAATILALALATNHGLLEEGGPNVQKKDDLKGLRGNAAKVDSSLEHAAVGRKLDFGYYECPPGQTLELDRRVCSFCSNEEPGEGEGCTEAASDL